MRLKKIFGFAAVMTMIAISSAMFAAFEAHIINVTAHIENALSVNTEPVAFGTVFPQEFIEKDFQISLSDSFMDEPRVDDVKYVIKQKLKACPVHKESCGPACEKLVPDDPTCVEDTELETPHNPTGWHYLSLCPFLSKNNEEGDGNLEQNDTSHPSYYIDNPPAGPSENDSCQDPGPDATGELSKDVLDTTDLWTLDLKVPPVEGFVGQDWPEDCIASAYIVKNNNTTYGCDLWIEVTDISLRPET